MDDRSALEPAPHPGPRIWLGTVVPKRHARRAVTRNLIKRQIRNAAVLHGSADARALAPGLWVVRLRAPFERPAFASAASPALRRAARQEIDDLLLRCHSRPVAPAAQASSP